MKEEGRRVGRKVEGIGGGQRCTERWREDRERG